MKHSESQKEISTSLIHARMDIDNLYPSAKGYSNMTYIPLEKIVDHLKAVLPGHKLGYIQLPFDGGTDSIGLTTRIMHESGEWLEESCVFPFTDLKGGNRSQGAGSALTYFRRYALCAAFGITGDEDANADTGDGETIPAKFVELAKSIEKTQTIEDLRTVYTSAYKEAKGTPSEGYIVAKYTAQKTKLTK